MARTPCQSSTATSNTRVATGACKGRSLASATPSTMALAGWSLARKWRRILTRTRSSQCVLLLFACLSVCFHVCLPACL